MSPTIEAEMRGAGGHAHRSRQEVVGKRRFRKLHPTRGGEECFIGFNLSPSACAPSTAGRFPFSSPRQHSIRATGPCVRHVQRRA